MQEAAQPARVIRFGPFEADLYTRELRKRGIRIKLQDQPFQILAMLLERPGELVTREEIRTKLWPEDTFVDFDHGLNAAIRRLREALNDSADIPRYVETLPRRGYRFLAPVGTAAPAAASPAAAKTPQVLQRRRRWGSGWLIAATVTTIALLVVLLTLRFHTSSSGRSTHSIVVLPFVNLSSDPEQEYFSDGMTEELISELGSLQPDRLGVIARSSAMKYKGARVGIDQVGNDLGVDYVLEGSIRRENEQIRVTAQLIRVSDQKHVWARNYERTRGGILAMQQEIAAAIASEIEIELTPQYQQRVAALQFTDPRAHDSYVRGRFFWNKRTDADLATAIEYFEQVLKYEPHSALAYSGLADAYFYRSYAFGNIPPAEGMPKARAAAIKALEWDPNLAEAHTSMALVRFFYDWDWAAAEAEFKRAIELNPNYPTAHHGYAVLLLTVYGRWEDAIREANRALELDPLSVPLNNIVALILVHSPRYDEAIERSRKLQELSPNSPQSYWYLSTAYEGKGAFPEAVAASLKAHTLAGESDQHVTRLRDAFASGGITAYRHLEAALTIEKSRQQAPRAVLDRLGLARAYAQTGDLTAALNILQNVCDERSGMAVWTKIDYSAILGMNSDRRFQALLQRIGFPN